MKKIFTFILLAACLLAMAGCANSNTANPNQDTGSAVNRETSQNTDDATTENDTLSNGASVSTDAANMANNTTTDSPAVIGEDAAKAAALEHAGLTEDEVTFLLANLDRDDGRNVYDVEFYADLKEYDYEIDAYSGEIVSHDFEIEGYAADSEAGGKTTTTQQGSDAAITLEEAKTIALEKAGVSESDATFTETSLEHDDGMAVYQIDFISGTIEYEVEVNANTGDITEYDAESIYD